MKRKANDWRVRLNEEIKFNNNWTFVTLTFNDESIIQLAKDSNCKYTTKEKPSEINNPSELITYAIRHFLERWRKQYKKSIKHWLIPELGHNGTERVHIHGLINTKDHKEITNKWKYGFAYCGYSVNEKTINYIVKYVTKIDVINPWFNGKIHASPGIGSKFKSSYNMYDNEKTIEQYISPSGLRLSLPIYYRNKLWTEEQREQLWINKLDKNIRFVGGLKINVSTDDGEKLYWKTVKSYRETNANLGYGKLDNWDEKIYKKSLKKLQIKNK